jgi:hypothetical protein
MDDNIEWWRIWKNELPEEFSQPPLESISDDRRLPILGHDQSNARMIQMRKGSDHPNIEMLGSESLPCSCNITQIGAVSNSAAALEWLRLMRRRTCSEAGR